MSGRPRQDVIRDDALEAALADLRAHLAVPPTPPIVEAMHPRLAALQADRAGRSSSRTGSWRRPAVWRRPSLRLALLLAIIALLVAAGLAVAVRLGLPGLRITFGEPARSSIATVAPTAAGSGAPSGTPAPGTSAAPSASSPSTPSAPSTSATPEPSPSPVFLGAASTVPAARAAVSFRVLLPDPALAGGAPEVYLDQSVPGDEVNLAYAGPAPSASRPPVVGADGQPIALLITETAGRLNEAILEKSLRSSTTIRHVTVNGAPAFWISGEVHELFVLDRSGQPRLETLREVGDVLVWVQDGTLIRIESPLGLEATLRVAASMH